MADISFKMRYVEARVKRGGRKGNRTLWYWRRRGFPLRRLPDNPTSPEFVALVQQLNAEADATKQTQAEGALRPNSLADIIERYQKTAQFQKLRETTKREYKHKFDILKNDFGSYHILSITREVIEAYQFKWRDKPFKADGALSVLRILFNYAIKQKIVKDNPVSQFERLSPDKPRIDKIWRDADINTFNEKASDSLKLALTLALHTAQRQGDLINLTWNQYDKKENVIKIWVSKTEEYLEIPVHYELRIALHKAKKVSTHILTTESGQPFKAYHFRHLWTKTVRDAGLDLQFRDLRRTAMTNLAVAGCEVPEIASISGHDISYVQRIIDRYVNPRSLAKKAMAKSENESRRKSKRFARKSPNRFRVTRASR